jgi:hypothetical protein
MSGNSGARSSGAEAGTQQQMPTPSSSANESPSGTQSARQPITGNTQGVVGISNLRLEAGTNPTQGSLVSSEKNNVKLESGTLMLLRVAQ